MTSSTQRRGGRLRLPDEQQATGEEEEGAADVQGTASHAKDDIPGMSWMYKDIEKFPRARLPTPPGGEPSGGDSNKINKNQNKADLLRIVNVFRMISKAHVIAVRF